MTLQRLSWKSAWQQRFKTGIITGFIVLAATLVFFPFFFSFIEARKGVQLHDVLLVALPAYDVSVPIFLVIWSMTLLILVRCIQYPTVCLLFLWSYIFLSLSRIILIGLVPLEPPFGLLELKDPLTDVFYGGRFISKDLFYSGHTATQFLIFLCVPGKKDKLLALAGTILIALLLLVQHVHYSIDIFSAPFFSYLVYLSAKTVCKRFFAIKNTRLAA